MSERKGSLMRWHCDCGHWTVCYSLEPTPTQCPDCADKGRKALEDWRSDISDASSHASDCMNDDVAGWLAYDHLTLPEDTVKQLQRISDDIREAWGLLDSAYDDMNRLIQAMPAAERLSMRGVHA